MSLALVFAFAALGADPLPEAAQKELKQLQGKWVMTRAERNGKSFDFTKERDIVLIVEIKDDKWLIGRKDGPQEDKARITLIDPSTNPKCLDTTSREKGFEGTVTESIYKLEGDTLTICGYQGTYKRKERQRPGEFKSTDDDTVLMVLKRVKP